MANSRRGFLKATTAAAAMAGLSRCARSGPGPGSGRSDRPNVLVVLDDQERWPVHPLPVTHPHRDRIKDRALEFTRAFCTYPLCSPSRTSLLTGRYPHEVGVLTNIDFALKNPSLSPEVPNLGRVLGKAGYRTAYFGKWHLSRRSHGRESPRIYGFHDAHVSNEAIAYHSDPRVTRDAADWIDKNRSSAPWFMVYAPINPHDICFRFLDRFYGGQRDYPVVLPPNFEPTEAPAIKTVQDFKEFAWTKRVIPADKKEWEEYLKFYCYLLEDVDRSLGRILDALAASGQMDHTIIVFTSDHGEMAGSHGMVHKGHSMYEENLRIPLWIRDPRAQQGFRQSDALVSNLDLPATLAGLLGLDWPGPLSGVDLSPLVRGEKNFALARDHVFAEGALRPEIAWRGVRTPEWKYWHYLNGEELLFHLSDDPLEMKNLAPDKNARDALLQFRSSVQSWRRETKDPYPGFIS